jgi:CubicO group peptidase (beta-lactamase class C family)
MVRRPLPKMETARGYDAKIVQQRGGIVLFRGLGLLCAAMAALLPVGGMAACAPPPAGADGWPVAEPDSVGLDADRLCALTPWIAGWKDGDIHAVLVARHGKLVFEQYFSGADENWGRPLGNDTAHSRDRLHDARSVTKSVVALVLGIALDRGLVKGGLDTPVLDLLPQYADLRTPEKAKITLRDLLTMSAGLNWKEDIPYGDPGNERRRWIAHLTRRGSCCRGTLSRPRAKSMTTAAAAPR